MNPQTMAWVFFSIYNLSFYDKFLLIKRFLHKKVLL